MCTISNEKTYNTDKQAKDQNNTCTYYYMKNSWSKIIQKNEPKHIYTGNIVRYLSSTFIIVIVNESINNFSLHN